MSPTVDDIIAELAALDLLDVAESIARYHGVTKEDALGRSHRRAPSAARQHLWAELYQRTSMSYSDLGALFGRDHTTIITGVAAHQARMNGVRPLVRTLPAVAVVPEIARCA
jgi:chromosomal replication initiation ATPase DnaA